jgi:hypothetical protein
MTARQADVLTAIGLAGLLAAVVLTAPRWAAALRAPAAASLDEEGEAQPPAPEPSATAAAARRINVRLYFEVAGMDRLAPEEREVPFSPDLPQQLRTVVEEIAKGPVTKGLLPTLPAGTQVLEVFVRRGGVVYVDLSSEARGLPAGSWAELLTTYSLVNTIVTNFPTTNRVQILVNDQAVPSLVGHVDLSRPLAPDMTFVSLVLPGAAPEGEGAGGAVPSPPAAR